MVIALNVRPPIAGWYYFERTFFLSNLRNRSIFQCFSLFNSNTWNSLGSGSTRKEGNRSQYFEGSSDSFDDEDDDENEQAISVSSRGRHRKISSRVRRYFLE